MSKLTLNLSMLGPRPTGLGVYAEHCARYLERSATISIVSSYYKPDVKTSHINSPAGIAIGSGRLSVYLRILFSFLWKGRFDELVYTPSHHGFFRHKNQIITILDLIPVRHATQNKFQHYYFKWLMPLIINNSRAIFTLSDTAKNDISSYYSVPKEHIYVVPCGIDTEIFKPAQRDILPEENYLLVIGASYPHKNIAELIDNWQLWKGCYKLKIASARGKYKNYLASIVVKYNLSNEVEFIEYVPDNQLVALIQNCQALVFPSLWEGFGMPPLEAMACGRPTIVSDIDVHKEIMEDVPIYITPGSSESWRRAFSILQDNAIVQAKIAHGLRLVQNYSWDRSGEKLLDALVAVDPDLSALFRK